MNPAGMEYENNVNDYFGLDLSDVAYHHQQQQYDHSYCPCLHDDEQQQQQQTESLLTWASTTGIRLLQETGTTTNNSTNSTSDGSTTTTTQQTYVIWEIVFTSVVLFLMFLALISDRIGADSIMITTLTLFMASGIISVSEGLTGFSNEGLLTVMTLFIVADGISKTGALDWYMAKLLGRPNSAAAAQLRLMIPISCVSAFLNNVPIVAVMIPIIQRWSKNIRLNIGQLLIPLSFASILGGTCTLIGTSTNLVVAGLLYDTYPDDPNLQIGLFNLGEYGVPIAMAGMSYVLLASPFLLPGGTGNKTNKDSSASPPDAGDDLLLRARLTPWSPAAGRTIKRSGLRDTGGIYLVSVQRAQTGNLHRAVSADFVLQTGDILFFTGLIETFGEFCNEHGLEVVTNEVEEKDDHDSHDARDETGNQYLEDTQDFSNGVNDRAVKTILHPQNGNPLPCLAEEDELGESVFVVHVPKEVGCTKESLIQADETERLQSITRMSDMIHGFQSNRPSDTPGTPTAGTSTATTTTILANSKTAEKNARKMPATATQALQGHDPPNIVVTIEKDLVVVGINCRDRPGLLLDISKGLLRLNLQLKHTEAAVIDERSVSIWRCEVHMPDEVDEDQNRNEIPIPDVEEVWSVLSALLSQETGIEAMKQRGLRVIRARVTKDSRLVSKTASEVDFKKRYNAAIVAIQSGGRNISQGLSSVRLNEGDILILQSRDDSALLKRPPDDFYSKQAGKRSGLSSRESSVQSLVNLIKGKKNSNTLEIPEGATEISPVKPFQESVDAANAEDDAPDKVSGTFFIPSGEHYDQLMKNSDSSSDPEALDGDLEQTDISGRQALEEERAIWADLQVFFTGDEDGDSGDKVAREFLTAMQVSKNAKWAGKSATQVGLHKLPDVFLVSIDRQIPSRSNVNEGQRKSYQQKSLLTGHDIRSFCEEESEMASTNRTDVKAFISIDQDEPLQKGDILWFSGPASAVGDLRKIPGLISYEDEEVRKMNEHVHDRRLVQAVISRKGPLVGKSVKDTKFRTRYGAAVIAVHREGKRVHEHPGNIKLQAGDVLLLEAGPNFFAKTAQNDRSFALLAEVEDSAPPRLRLLIPALVLAVLMLAVYVAGLVSLLVSALCASILMVAVGILSEQEVRDALNWEVYIIIASAFGIGIALVNSGVAEGIANFIVAIGAGIGIGDAGLFGAIYFATFLISNVVTNNAAAALVFPIAMEAADKTGTDKLLMSYTLMLGASASFMTPFGYTTNLMIYGPGGYKFTDFVYFGFPMQIVLWILSTVFLVLRPWYISWIATAALLAFVIIFRLCSERLRKSFNNLAHKAQVHSD